MPGETEIILIIAVFVLLFGGATMIPKLARSLGSAKGEFNKAKREFDDEARRAEAAAQTSPVAANANDAQVRKTAQGLGIDDTGKSTDELKILIQQKLA